jgi:hypothetical protein
MLTKLTLSVEDEVVEGAKEYSQRHNTSISKLVNNFLASLAKPDVSAHPPVVRRLMGVLPSSADESEYYAHLDEKYGM